MKLVKKVRVGSRVRRVSDRPHTPLEHVEACPEVDPGTLAPLRTLRARLDPFQLAQVIEHTLERLYALAHHRARPTLNATELTPVETQAIEPITRRFGIPVPVGKYPHR